MIYEKIQMNNYEKIKSLSKEELAKFNVKAFAYMNGR